MMNDRCSRFS